MVRRVWDVLILGGGAAGLVCAIEAKRRSGAKSVAIIEKNDRVGKKLLATGNGRCNLTNTNINGNTQKYYIGSFSNQAEKLLREFDADALRRYFSGLGLLTREDSEGRCYVMAWRCSAVSCRTASGKTASSFRSRQRKMNISQKSW